MSFRTRNRAFAFVGGGLIVAGVVLAFMLAPMALGQSTTVRVVSPGTASVGQSVAVTINVDDVVDLAVYEWQLAYNPNVLELASAPNPVDGGFLGSAGRSVTCFPPIFGEGTVRFGCVSSGSQAGASTSGLLSTVTFTAKAAGSSSLCLRWASLGNTDQDFNDIPLSPGQYQHASIAVGGGSPPAPSCAPAATPTQVLPPATFTPGATLNTPEATPQATATSGPPAATATPQGPTPTPAPTPPPESAETMNLIAGCNPLATTYPDGTTVQTLTYATSPVGILEAIWKFEGGVWRGYSPEFPQASDLTVTSFLDVVFLCVDGPGTFVRPLV
jgi:hypothetical protein